MNKLALILSTLLISFYSFSQKTENHSVKLYSGESISGEKLLYVNPIMKTPLFELDGKKFESHLVQFLENNHGYFANLNKIYGEKSERYALRIKSGKIAIFEEVDMEFYGGDDLPIDKNSEKEKSDLLASGEVFQYYTKLDGSIQKASYKNLKADMSDNEQALKELRLFQTYKFLQIGLIATGAGLIAYDILRQSNDDVRFSPVMAVGIVVGGSSYLLENKKSDARFFAVEAYNKE